MFDGVDGAPVFGTSEDGGEGWRDRLCEPAPSDVPCGVISFRQLTTRLTVTYEIFDDKMEGLELPFGPLPTEELAGCIPQINQVAEAQVQGQNNEGTQIWQAVAVNPPNAETGQGKEMRISAARVD